MQPIQLFVGVQQYFMLERFLSPRTLMETGADPSKVRSGEKKSIGNKFEISPLRSGLPDLHNLSQVLLLDTNLCQQVSLLSRPELSQLLGITNGFQVSALPVLHFPPVKYSYFPVSLGPPLLSSPGRVLSPGVAR